MNDLEKMREFVKSFPGADVLSELTIDYTDEVPGVGGLFPSGLVEVRRRKFITGGAEVDNQLNFALYAKLEKAPGDDELSTINASWLMDFQTWIQEQSVRGLAPVFGDVPQAEKITAGNGEIYSASDEGWALYVIRIQVSFTKQFN